MYGAHDGPAVVGTFAILIYVGWWAVGFISRKRKKGD